MPFVFQPPMIDIRPRGILPRNPAASERKIVAVAELKHMRNVESGEAPLQLGLFGSCRLEKLPSQVTLSSALEESSMDFDQV